MMEIAGRGAYWSVRPFNESLRMDEASGDALSCQILVVGAGLAGLIAAIGFEQAGFDVILCGAPEQINDFGTISGKGMGIQLGHG